MALLSEPDTANETTRPDDDASSEESTPQTVDKTGGRIREMFSEISPRYDFMNHALSGGTDHYWRWRTVRRVPPIGDAPILDVCTGTGDLALAYWKRGRGNVPVVGSDFTHEMLAIANEKQQRQQIPQTGNPSLTFLEADTLHLPFEENLFQIVSVAFGLRNVSDTLEGLREMTRVCRPGGRVAVLEFAMPRNRALRSVYKGYFRHVLPRIGQVLMRNNQAAYEYLPQSVQEFPQYEELGGIMNEAGLTDVTWTPLTFGIAVLYVGVKPE